MSGRRVGWGILFVVSVAALGDSSAGPLPWPEANRILASVVPPKFPDRSCAVTDLAYGGKGDGVTDNTAAFRQAIAACARAGGGHVTVPAGNFVSGAIQLDNNIDLHLEAGATITFSGDVSKYDPPVLTRHEGIEVMNHSPMIYAYGKHNIGITGSGTLDAEATASWNRNRGKGRTQLTAWGEGTIPPAQRRLAEGDSLAVAFVETYDCRDVLIQGITLKGAHWWQFHPTLSTNVTLDGVTALGDAWHTDGVDPESCTNVIIKNASLTTGDDGIAIKSGRDNDGRRVGKATTNVVIMHTSFQLKKGAFGGMITLGSEMSGDIRHVYAYDLKAIGVNKFLLYMKSNMDRGGTASDVHIDSVTGSNFQTAVAYVTFKYSKGGTLNFKPTFDDISISHVTVDGAPIVLQVEGLPNAAIGSIRLDHDMFTNIAKASSVTDAKPVTYDRVTINGVAQ